MNFETVIYKDIDIVYEIFNSQKEYCKAVGKEKGYSKEDIINELDFENENIVNLFIKLDDTYIGFIQIMLLHPRDLCPWIGLLMIHKDYEGYGFGTQAVDKTFDFLKEKNVEEVKLGIIPENKKAIQFWEGIQFEFFEQRQSPIFGEVLVYGRSL